MIGLLLLLAADNPWPSRAKTPGATNPAVTQANIAETVCKPGWTSSIRPSVNYTRSLKRKQLHAMGLDTEPLGAWEEDHLIPLGLGGHPSDERNLLPQRWGGKCGARAKDRLETELHHEVCARHLTLAAAQRTMLEWCAP